VVAVLCSMTSRMVLASVRLKQTNLKENDYYYSMNCRDVIIVCRRVVQMKLDQLPMIPPQVHVAVGRYSIAILS
jgi:hypothetical protein